MNVSESTSENNHTSSSAKIQVIAIRFIDKGAVRAIADVGLGSSLTIREFKVIQQSGQRAWVSPPSREWKGTDGKRHFTPLVELLGSLRKRVEQAVLEAWERSEGGRAHG
jgi:DNA-binding cell septation regulator SpoVG